MSRYIKPADPVYHLIHHDRYVARPIDVSEV
jgi:hypothetical protein